MCHIIVTAFRFNLRGRAAMEGSKEASDNVAEKLRHEQTQRIPGEAGKTYRSWSL